MSISTDKSITRAKLEEARQRIEQAIASFDNGDIAKVSVRVKQFNDAFKSANVLTSSLQDKIDVVANAQATKDDVSK